MDEGAAMPTVFFGFLTQVGSFQSHVNYHTDTHILVFQNLASRSVVVRRQARQRKASQPGDVRGSSVLFVRESFVPRNQCVFISS